MKYLLLLLFTGLLFSCEENKQEPIRTDGFTPILKNAEDSLFHDIMKGHDTAMAKMSKLNRYIQQSQLLIAAKKELKLNNALNLELRLAEESMSNWMLNFKADTLQGQAGRLEYLRAEKIKVQEMRDRVLTAIKKGDSLLREK